MFIESADGRLSMQGVIATDVIAIMDVGT